MSGISLATKGMICGKKGKRVEDCYFPFDVNIQSEWEVEITTGQYTIGITVEETKIDKQVKTSDRDIDITIENQLDVGE